MVKYLSFDNSSKFALRYFLMQMARPQCDTPLVSLVNYYSALGANVGLIGPMIL